MMTENSFLLSRINISLLIINFSVVFFAASFLYADALGWCVCNEENWQTTTKDSAGCAIFCQDHSSVKSFTPNPGPPAAPTAPTLNNPSNNSGGNTQGQTTSNEPLQNPIRASSFSELVQDIAKAVTAVGIPLVAIFLIYSGFLFVTAGGNEQQLEKAKTTLKWSLVGAAIIIGAYAIATAIVNFARTLG